MFAVASGGGIEPLCGYRGLMARLVRPTPNDRGWRVEQREFCTGCSPAGGEAFTNAITGLQVTPSPPVLRANDWTIDRDAAGGLAWSVQQGRMMLDQPFRVVPDHDGDDPTGYGMRESLSFTFSPEDVGGTDRRSAIRSSGTMLRTTAWPGWLGMGRSPGHVLCQARFVAGLRTLTEVPPAVRSAFGGMADNALTQFA